MPKGRQNRNSDLAGSDRLEAISRFFTKICRHGQKACDGPPLDWNPRREAYIQHIAEHPSFQALSTSEEDFRQIASDMDDDEKRRIYAKFEENTGLYVAGCFNGHTQKVEKNPNLLPMKKPVAFAHATAWEAACRILKEGLRTMGRNDMHMVPLRMKPRQEAYLKPSSRKTHVLTIDAVAASAAGIQFYELDNGVVITRGINGLLPPCCISGLFSKHEFRTKVLGHGSSKS